MVWWDEALANEMTSYLLALVMVTIAFVFLFEEVEALSYEIFMWGDIGMVSDVRYYGVAPHWYFRPFMAWLIACPFHKTGIFGLVYFFISVYFQPSLHGSSEQGGYAKKPLSLMLWLLGREDMFSADYTFLESNLYYQTFFFSLCGAPSTPLPSCPMVGSLTG